MRREKCYLQAGNPGSKENHYILPVKAGLLQRSLPLLGGKSSPRHFHRIQLRTGVQVSTHRTLPTELVNQQMVQSVPGLPYTAF